MLWRIWVKRIHLILALSAAIPLMVASLTGASLVFFKPSEYLLNKSAIDVVPTPERMSLTAMISSLQQQYPGVNVTGVSIPAEKNRALQFWASGEGDAYWYYYVNPYDGKVKGFAEGSAFSISNLVRWTIDLHYSLKAGSIGSKIVGIATIVLIFLTFSGLALWAPRSLKGLPHRFKIKVAKRWKQNAFNWHSAFGFYFSLALFFIALTGVTMAFRDQVDPVVYALLNSEKAPETPQVAPRSGQATLDLDVLLGKAQLFIEEKYGRKPWPDYIGFPVKENAVANIYLQESSELWGVTSYAVAVDAYTGQILSSQTPQSRNRAESVLSWVGAVHYGSWGDIFGSVSGLFTRIVWIFAGLMPFGLAITGVTIWRKPAFYRQWKKKK